MNAEGWANLNDTHARALAALAPDIGSDLGLIDCDRRLPNPALATGGELLTALRAWQGALQQIPAADLTPEQEIDRIQFVDHVALIDFVADRMAQHALDPDALAGWGRRLAVVLWQRPHSADNLAALAAQLRATPEHLAGFRAIARRPCRLLLEDAKVRAAAAPALLDFVVDRVKRADAPVAASDEVTAAVALARTALAEHTAWLEQLSATDQALPHYPEEVLQDLCRRRKLPFAYSELADFVAGVVNELRVERDRWVRRIDPTATARQILDRMRGEQPLTFDAGLAALRSYVDAARAFLDENELFELADDERLAVEATPAELAGWFENLTLVPALRGTPVQFGTVLAVAPGAQQTLAGLSPTELLQTAVAIGYPGQHLLLLSAHRATGVLRSRLSLAGYGLSAACWGDDAVDGWAGYCSEMMRQEGYIRAPNEQLQQLEDALAHAQLAAVDLDLAAGRVEPGPALERLVGEAGLAPASAQRELVRQGRSPLRRVSALLGEDQLFKLRRRAKAQWREDFVVRQFHSLVLSTGTVPLCYLAERLLGDDSTHV